MTNNSLKKIAGYATIGFFILALIVIGGRAYTLKTRVADFKALASESTGLVSTFQVIESSTFATKVVIGVNLAGANNPLQIRYAGSFDHGWRYYLTGELAGAFDVYLAPNGARAETPFAKSNLVIHGNNDVDAQGVFIPNSKNDGPVKNGTYDVHLSDNLKTIKGALTVEDFAVNSAVVAKTFNAGVSLDTRNELNHEVFMKATDVKIGQAFAKNFDLSLKGANLTAKTTAESLVINFKGLDLPIYDVHGAEFELNTALTDLPALPAIALINAVEHPELLQDDLKSVIALRTKDIFSGGPTFEIKSIKFSDKSKNNLIDFSLKSKFPEIRDQMDPSWSTKITVDAKLHMSGPSADFLYAAAPSVKVGNESEVNWAVTYDKNGTAVNGKPASEDQKKTLQQLVNLIPALLLKAAQ